jgi:signal transduction histidine kinase
MDNIKKPLILIVDDTSKNIQVLGNILHSKGYNIHVSSNGEEALESVKTNLPDLILLDIQMPGMDGFEVCKILKLNPATKDIPVIFLTVIIDHEKILHGFELGAVDYITKPFSIPELTARVATHIEIKQSREKLIELNATKDKFFGIVAHDLRNPFAGIIGVSSEIKKILLEQESKNSAQLLSYAQLILESSESALALLENLTQWAISQTGKIKVIQQDIPARNLIFYSTASINGIAFKKNVTIENNVDESYRVYADIELASTIIRNLMTNAIKFTHANGKITVSAEKKDDFLEISIADTGVGMSSKNLEKIFRIDSKFSSLGTEKEKGTGLGLILCKEFVEKQGGSIWVESEEEKGSTFTFTLPLHELNPLEVAS